MKESSIWRPQIWVLLQNALLFYCGFYTDCLGGMTDAVMHHMSSAQITCSTSSKRWQFGLVINVVGHISNVNKCSAQLVLGWVTVWQAGKPSRHVTSHPGQLSLAIPQQISTMNKLPVKARSKTGTSCDALALYPWSHSVIWYLAEG